MTLSGNSYIQDFNGISAGLPAGWSGRTGASATALGSNIGFATAATAWNATSLSFANYASATGFNGSESTATQTAATDRAFGARQTGGADPGLSFNVEIANTINLSNFAISFDAMLLSVQTRSTSYSIQYGLGANPSSYTTIGTYDNPGSFGIKQQSFNLSNTPSLSAIENQSGPVWVRMVALSASSGTGSRDTVAIDNFSLTWSGTVVAPAVPQYWDLNGSTTGIGGAAGTWDTVSSFWNAASDGGSSTGGPTA